jgi:hypothetical protein
MVASPALHIQRTLQAALLAALFAVAAYAIGREQKKPERLEPGEAVLWSDPGDPSLLDFQYGAGGREGEPRPPFRFISEDVIGTNPKINVVDGHGRTWNVKWGEEASPSVFATRLVWACGYFVQPEYFVALGRIEGADDLKRAKAYVKKDGSFRKARFQLRVDSPKYLEGQGWKWTDNPFLHTRELGGLKIAMLLVSNWDAKDARDVAPAANGGVRMDSNLAIFADDSTGERRYIYANDDWGASMGKWGGFARRSKWDCKGYEEQTPDFLKLEDDGKMDWGFQGKHRKDLTADITKSDVQWLLTYLGRITDEQIRRGLTASGASPVEADCFTRALRERIEQLRQAAAV